MKIVISENLKRNCKWIDTSSLDGMRMNLKEYKDAYELKKLATSEEFKRTYPNCNLTLDELKFLISYCKKAIRKEHEREKEELRNYLPKKSLEDCISKK